MIVTREITPFKKIPGKDSFEGMTPEAYHGRTDEGYDANGDKTTQGQNDSIDTTYTDLVGRIDRFLNDPSPSTTTTLFAREHSLKSVNHFK